MSSSKTMKLDLHAEFPYEEESEHTGLGSTRTVGYAVKGTPFRVTLKVVTKSKVSLSQAQVQMHLLTEETYAPVEIGEMPIKFEATTAGSVIYCDTRLFVLSTQLAKSCVVIKAVVTLDGNKPLEALSCPIKVVSKPEQIRKKRKEANQEPELEGSKKRARSEDVLARLRSLYGSALQNVETMKRLGECEVVDSESRIGMRVLSPKRTRLTHVEHDKDDVGCVDDLSQETTSAMTMDGRDSSSSYEEGEEETSWLDGTNPMHLHDRHHHHANTSRDEESATEEEEERSVVSHLSLAETMSEASTLPNDTSSSSFYVCHPDEEAMLMSMGPPTLGKRSCSQQDSHAISSSELHQYAQSATSHTHHHDSLTSTASSSSSSNSAAPGSMSSLLLSFERILTSYDALCKQIDSHQTQSDHYDQASSHGNDGQGQESSSNNLGGLSSHGTLKPPTSSRPRVALANKKRSPAECELASAPLERLKATFAVLGVPTHLALPNSITMEEYH